jgi:hypothetical protein
METADTPMHRSVAAMSRQGRSSDMSFLVLVADDAPDAEMRYAPGTRRRIKAALKIAATMEAKRSWRC